MAAPLDDVTIDQVRETIAALSIPSRTNEANVWLVEFGKSQLAWTIAHHLISESATKPQDAFFGAIILHSKVQRDIVHLEPSLIPQLMQSLVQHVMRLCGESPFNMNICRYVCLSIATVALQTNQEGVFHQMLGWLNPILSSHAGVVLELLIVLPEGWLH